MPKAGETVDLEKAAQAKATLDIFGKCNEFTAADRCEAASKIFDCAMEMVETKINGPNDV